MQTWFCRYPSELAAYLRARISIANFSNLKSGISVFFMEADRFLQRMTWNSKGCYNWMRSVWCKTDHAFHSVFASSSFACLTPQNDTWSTSAPFPDMPPISPAARILSQQSTAPFSQLPSRPWAMVAELSLQIGLGGGTAACHCRGVTCLCLKQGTCAYHWGVKSTSGQWSTGAPCPTWFNYFYFNLRPLFPLQCLVNTTF